MFASLVPSGVPPASLHTAHVCVPCFVPLCAECGVRRAQLAVRWPVWTVLLLLCVARPTSHRINLPTYRTLQRWVTCCPPPTEGRFPLTPAEGSGSAPQFDAGRRATGFRLPAKTGAGSRGRVAYWRPGTRQDRPAAWRSVGAVADWTGAYLKYNTYKNGPPRGPSTPFTAPPAPPFSRSSAGRAQQCRTRACPTRRRRRMWAALEAEFGDTSDICRAMVIPAVRLRRPRSRRRRGTEETATRPRRGGRGRGAAAWRTSPRSSWPRSVPTVGGLVLTTFSVFVSLFLL